jgi:hypothetical protein
MSGRSLGGQGQRAITTPVATIGVRGTIVEGVVGDGAQDVLKAQPGLPSLPADLSGAAFIVLVGPGPLSQGFDKPGAIDVTLSNGQVITLNRPGEAILVLPGGQVVGPFDLSDQAAGRLADQLVPPSTPGSGPGQSAGLESGAINTGPPPPPLSVDPGLQLPVILPQ